MAIIRTEYREAIKWESGAELYDAETGRYITTTHGKQETSEFLKNHFENEFFPCPIRVEFDGIPAYKFELE